MSNTTVERIVEAAKDAPIVGVSGAVVFGVPLNNVIIWATLVWAVVRAAQASLELYWKWKDRREQGK